MIAAPDRRARLVAALDYIAREKRAGTEPAIVVRRLVEEHGATHHVRAWTSTLRCVGVTTSCTSSRDKGLLENLTRLAHIHLMRLDGRCE